MLSHDRVWAAIDALAERYSLSASGLARRAGLEFDRLQQVETPVLGRPAALALDRIAGQDHRGDRRFARRIHRADRRPHRASAPAPAGAPCRCSALPRPAPAASSTMPAFRPGRAGIWSNCRRNRPKAPMRCRCKAIPCCRSTAMATCSSSSRAPITRKGDRVVVKTTCRRGDGQGARAPDRQIDRAGLAQSRSSRTATFAMREVEWVARIVWASQ